MSLTVDIQSSAPANVDGVIAGLWDVYRSALDRFATLQDGLVARSLVRRGTDWILTEPSPLNTAEVLRALFLMESHGIRHSWDSRALLRRLASDPICRNEVQVATLALWAAAVGRDPVADEIFSDVRGRMEGDCGQSMTLGWAICALCEYAKVDGRSDKAQCLANQLLTRLLENQNAKSGLFHPSDRREGLLRRRMRETTLSSQTYAILGIATYSRVFSDLRSLSAAERCARTICARQGPQGQWWWRYDAASGEISSRYPVYCVNQDSAAPAALRALQHALGDSRYEQAITRGVEWELGSNEVEHTLVDANGGTVARAVEESATGFVVDHELYSYQPARFICAILAERAQ